MVLPELAGIGAVAVKRAYLLSVRNRLIGPVSPISLAAVRVWQPGSSSSCGLWALTSAASLAFVFC